ncbi:MAG: fumarylacetoacetase, partial [Comamonadaceae bacterium]
MHDQLNETHDPALRSWVASAQDAGTDFPIQNLPFGVFRARGSDSPFRGGVAIGDQVLDLAAVVAAGVVPADALAAATAAAGPTLHPLMAMPPAAWSTLRRVLSRLLRDGAAEQEVLRACLVPQDDVEHAVPAAIGDYTDFFTSIDHAINAGRLFRPENPLLPNYRWVPIGYHGRASSIVVSGEPVYRPVGQVLPAGVDRVVDRGE